MKTAHGVSLGERRQYSDIFIVTPFSWRGNFYLAFERFLGGAHMETRVAVLGIIVENLNSIERLNGLLHDYGRYVIGRMGIPYREKNIHVISLAVDAPQDIISSLSGKIGKIDGISVKTAYSNVMTHE